MSATPLRPPVTPAHASVEDLIARIADLVLARQNLRAEGAEAGTLEENRRALVGAHWDLSRALIARYCKRDAA